MTAAMPYDISISAPAHTTTHLTYAEAPRREGDRGLPAAETVPQIGGTPLTAVMMGTIVLAAVNRRALGRALRGYSHQLWSVRRRHNAFDDVHTASPLMATLLALIFIVFGGVILYFATDIAHTPSFTGVMMSMALLGVYYIFELLAYRTVAYTFATREGGRRWVDGFVATQAYAGLALILPALLAVYEPQWRTTTITTSLAIYCIARLIFIIKGFRIFYTNFASLLYFILYLCTLEVIPVLAIYRASVYLWAFNA